MGILKRNPSPDSNDFLADLSREFKGNNVDSPLKDFFKNAPQKRNVLYDSNAAFDFTAGSLHPERLKKYGMNEYALNLVEKGIPVNLSYPLFLGDIKSRRNSKDIQIVRILQDQNVDCEVELDDFLIHANLYEKCMKNVSLSLVLTDLTLLQLFGVRA